MPVINLYQMACKVSALTFMAANSALEPDVSMVDCSYEYQLISDMFI